MLCAVCETRENVVAMMRIFKALGKISCFSFFYKMEKEGTRVGIKKRNWSEAGDGCVLIPFSSTIFNYR